MQHSSHDLLVNPNGIVKHMVIIRAEVNCEVNLFNYPFAADQCPVAIQTWADGGELSITLTKIYHIVCYFWICDPLLFPHVTS